MEEWEPIPADEDTPSGAAGQSNPIQDFRFYDSIHRAEAIDNGASPSGPRMQPHHLGPTDSLYAEYSCASYPELRLVADDSPGSSHHLRTSLTPPHAPSLSSSFGYAESCTSRSDSNKRSAFSSQLPTKPTHLEAREASLLRYYVDKIAPWVGSNHPRIHGDC